MQRGRKTVPILTIVAASLFSSSGFCQNNFARYLDARTIPLINPFEYLDVKFKWNMTGNIQVPLNQGLNSLKDGNIQQAILNFDEVIKLDSNLWVGYYYRGVANILVLKLKDAERDLDATSKLNPDLGEPYVERGIIYLLESRLEKASDSFNKSMAVDPTLTAGYYYLGAISLIKSDTHAAIKYYQKCNKVDPKFAPAYVMQGIIGLRAKSNVDELIPFFDKALEVDSSYTPTYFWRGLTYISVYQTQKCLRDWNRALSLDRDNPFLLVMHGFLQIELHDYDYAFTDLRKALLAHPVSRQKYVSGVTLLDQQIDLQSAALYLINHGYGLNEESFSLLKKGFCILIEDRKKYAVKIFRKAEQIEPSASVYYMEALTYYHLNRNDSALYYYSKALALDNNIFDAHLKRSLYLSAVKDWKGALSDIDKMIRLQPKSSIPYKMRGEINYMQNDYPSAIADLSLFLKTDSLNMSALTIRSAARARSGDKDGAANDSIRVLGLHPKMSFYDVMGDNFLLLQDTLSAIKFFSQFARLTNSMSVHLNLAKRYLFWKKWAFAKSELAILQQIPVPDNPSNSKIISEASYIEGAIEFLQGSFENAILKFSGAVDKDKANFNALYYRGKAYLAAGHKKEAMADFKRLKAAGFGNAQTIFDSVAEQLRTGNFNVWLPFNHK